MNLKLCESVGRLERQARNSFLSLVCFEVTLVPHLPISVTAARSSEGLVLQSFLIQPLAVQIG